MPEKERYSEGKFVFSLHSADDWEETMIMDINRKGIIHASRASFWAFRKHSGMCFIS
jgi:hypothetical protein